MLMRTVLVCATMAAMSVPGLGAAAQTGSYKSALFVDYREAESIGPRGAAWKIVLPKLYDSLISHGVMVSRDIQFTSKPSDTEETWIGKAAAINQDYAVVVSLYLKVDADHVPKIRVPVSIFSVKTKNTLYSNEPQFTALPPLPDLCDANCLMDNIGKEVSPKIEKIAETVALKIRASLQQ